MLPRQRIKVSSEILVLQRRVLIKRNDNLFHLIDADLILKLLHIRLFWRKNSSRRLNPARIFTVGIHLRLFFNDLFALVFGNFHRYPGDYLLDVFVGSWGIHRVGAALERNNFAQETHFFFLL
jgi:hypothetical protein